MSMVTIYIIKKLVQAARVSGGLSPIGDPGSTADDDPGDPKGGLREGDQNGGSQGWIKVSHKKKLSAWEQKAQESVQIQRRRTTYCSENAISRAKEEEVSYWSPKIQWSWSRSEIKAMEFTSGSTAKSWKYVCAWGRPMEEDCKLSFIPPSLCGDGSSCAKISITEGLCCW